MQRLNRALAGNGPRPLWGLRLRAHRPVAEFAGGGACADTGPARVLTVIVADRLRAFHRRFVRFAGLSAVDTCVRPERAADQGCAEQRA